MQTVLSWINPNTIPVVVKIYRNTTEVDRSNPGTALITLSNGETSWIDPTALAGVTYYYLVEVISASNPSEKILSRNYKTVTGKERGPGPQSLQYGDLNLGYFGTLTSAEFMSKQEFIAKAFPSPPREFYIHGSDGMIWHKFAYKNKILIVPDYCIARNATWMDLYNAGLVFGYDGEGKGNPANLPDTKVNQLRTVAFGKHDLIVRLPTGHDDTHVNTPAVASVAQYSSPYANEWDLIITALNVGTPDSQKLPNLSKNSNSYLGRTGMAVDGTSYRSPGGALCQETVNATSVVCRGGQGPSSYVGRSLISSYDSVSKAPGVWITGSSNANITVGSTSTAWCVGWWPILELVE